MLSDGESNELPRSAAFVRSSFVVRRLSFVCCHRSFVHSFVRSFVVRRSQFVVLTVGVGLAVMDGGGMTLCRVHAALCCWLVVSSVRREYHSPRMDGDVVSLMPQKSVTFGCCRSDRLSPRVVGLLACWVVARRRSTVEMTSRTLFWEDVIAAWAAHFERGAGWRSSTAVTPQ